MYPLGFTKRLIYSNLTKTLDITIFHDRKEELMPKKKKKKDKKKKKKKNKKKRK